MTKSELVDVRLGMPAELERLEARVAELERLRGESNGNSLRPQSSEGHRRAPSPTRQALP